MLRCLPGAHLPLCPYLLHLTSIRFDITSFDFESRETDEEGILRAAGWIKKIVDKEVNEEKIPPSKIVIGGFSQGGALSFAALLTLGAERKVAGVFGMSTYLPVGDHIHKVCIGNITLAAL